MLDGFENYKGREQSAVKHEVLKRYLESFAHVVGFNWNSITYIDGFSGPWSAQTEDLSDTSFSIALNQLRRARDTHAARGKNLGIRCVFVEEEEKAFKRLEEFAASVDDAEILTIHGEFEDAIPEIIRFIEQGKDTFPFVFIDPTGWTGFSMERIAPLLKHKPSEVLINFMLEFIRRFIAQGLSRESFQQLFGADDFTTGLKDLTGIDRDDEIAKRYCRALNEVCGFDFVHRAIVLHSDKDQSHFQLIYGTRHSKGVEKFKKVEEIAMEAQEESRAHYEVEKKCQPLFAPEEMPESQYYIRLRERYLSQAKKTIFAMVKSNSEVAYDDLWGSALAYPMVWESDLREWMEIWKREGVVEWIGLASRKRTLKFGERHIIRRKSE